MAPADVVVVSFTDNDAVVPSSGAVIPPLSKTHHEGVVGEQEYPRRPEIGYHPLGLGMTELGGPLNGETTTPAQCNRPSTIHKSDNATRKIRGTKMT